MIPCKKLRLTFLVCTVLLIPQLCVAQGDSIWFQQECKWIYDFISFGGPGKVYLTYAGIDTIDSVECVRLNYYGFTQPDHQIPPFIETWHDQFVYSRNDSVFLWHDEDWTLIYDFTLTEGDTMVLSSVEEFNAVVIEEIGLDTILNIPTRYQNWRKLHVLDTIYDYRITVFERLGGEFLLEDAFYLGSAVHEANYWLSCFRDDVFPVHECADPVVSINSTSPQVNLCIGYPNPTNASLTFELTHRRTNGEIHCVVYALHGQAVYQQQLNASRQVDIFRLPSALYFFVLKDSSNLTLGSGRFVKQ